MGCPNASIERVKVGDIKIGLLTEGVGRRVIEVVGVGKIWVVGTAISVEPVGSIIEETDYFGVGYETFMLGY